MGWYRKIARMKGVMTPIMDDYAKGLRPETEDHVQNPDGLTTARPEFGGNERPGYPDNYSSNSDNSDNEQWAKLHGEIPGEHVLMDDGGDSSEGLGDRFVSRGEGNSDDDTLPKGGLSDRLDYGDTGPHNMPHVNGKLFKKIKDNTKIKGLRS